MDLGLQDISSSIPEWSLYKHIFGYTPIPSLNTEAVTTKATKAMILFPEATHSAVCFEIDAAVPLGGQVVQQVRRV